MAKYIVKILLPPDSFIIVTFSELIAVTKFGHVALDLNVGGL